jgi:hypothetical protein
MPGGINTEWIAYYEENRKHALDLIGNMPLSARYRRELDLWINNYLDPFALNRTVAARKKDSADPFALIRTEAEKDLEFTVLNATGKDRIGGDILLLESNLLLQFNLLLSHIKAS